MFIYNYNAAKRQFIAGTHVIWYLNVKTVAVQHTAIQLHNSSLRLIFHHHVLKRNRKRSVPRVTVLLHSATDALIC